MALLVKDLVISEEPPVGYYGSIWLKYMQEDNSYQIYLPAGNSWQDSNIVLSSKEVTDALGYTPESGANKVTVINAQSTDTQYPSAKAVYDLTQTAIASAITIGYKPANKELVILHAASQ